MAKGKKLPASYFVFVNPIIGILTLAIVAFLVVSYVDHKHIAPEIFGPVADFATLLGTQYKFYLKIGLLGMAAIHITEALVAVYKCYKLKLNSFVTLAWTLQTLLFGILSLSYLLWPSKGGQQQQQQQQKQKQQKQKQQQQQGGKQGKQQQGKASKSKKEK